jgi:hypothetical protein
MSDDALTVIRITLPAAMLADVIHKGDAGPWL